MFCEKCGRENDDSSMFCMFCGSALKKEEETADDERSTDAEGGMTGRQIKIGLISIFTFLCVLLLCAYIFREKGPEAKFEAALNENDIDTAMEWFELLDEEETINARLSAKRYAAILGQKYLDEEEGYDYTFVRNCLDKLMNGILWEEEIENQSEQIEKINASRTAFSMAESYREEGSLLYAIQEYRAVITEDSEYYNKAQEILPELTEAFRGETLEKADEYMETQNFTEAETVLLQALEVMPADGELMSKLDTVGERIRESEINTIIETVDADMADRDFPQGFETLEAALEKYPEEASLCNQLEALKSSYKTAQLDQLAVYYGEENFTEAVLLLRETQKYLYEDEEIQGLLELYESYLPVSLVDLELYDKMCVSDIDVTLEDNFGNSYPNSILFADVQEAAFEGSFNSVGILEYLINGNYNRISGTVVYWGDVYPTFRRGESHLEIYSDDVLVYTSPQITDDTEPIPFEVSLGNNCHKLKIKLVPENWFNSYVILGDAEVYNR